ncbi:hypothetical protein R3P38DRAFT_2809530 [Favolaschia claudopus]|uniref:Uncharacterized protein n=1 Tax=Favolaschia claudopus TaxID=2862362 RepID=A0AAV9ZE76_9AGAR
MRENAGAWQPRAGCASSGGAKEERDSELRHARVGVGVAGTKAGDGANERGRRNKRGLCCERLSTGRRRRQSNEPSSGAQSEHKREGRKERGRGVGIATRGVGVADAGGRCKRIDRMSGCDRNEVRGRLPRRTSKGGSKGWPVGWGARGSGRTGKRMESGEGEQTSQRPNERVGERVGGEMGKRWAGVRRTPSSAATVGSSGAGGNEGRVVGGNEEECHDVTHDIGHVSRQRTITPDSEKPEASEKPDNQLMASFETPQGLAEPPSARPRQYHVTAPANRGEVMTLMDRNRLQDAEMLARLDGSKRKAEADAERALGTKKTKI